MIKIKAYPRQNKLVVLGITDYYNDHKVFKLSAIHSVHFNFFDNSETDGYFHFNLKKDVSNYFAPTQLCLPFDGDEMEEPIDDNQLLSSIFTYTNSVEVNNEDDYGECIHQFITKQFFYLQHLGINVILPNNNDDYFTKYIDWKNQKEAEDWWKEDLMFRNVFRNVFSRN